MNTLLTYAFVAAIVSTRVLANEDCRHDDTSFRCVEYIKNYDADTITVQIPGVHPLLGHRISVRVAGVDSAEMKADNPCEKSAARFAKDFVTSVLMNAKRIDLINIDRDKYFRVLAEVIVDGKSLSQLLIAQNLAYQYDGGQKQKPDWCSFIRDRK